MKKFLIFLTLDLASKYLAAVIAPDNFFFKLHYNQGLAFNYDAGHFLTYVFPVLVIPFSAYVLIKFSPRWAPLMLAGMVGNLFCRFLPCGVVDFMNFQLFVNNFADIYIWVAVGMMSLEGYKFYRDEKLNKTLKMEQI